MYSGCRAATESQKLGHATAQKRPLELLPENCLSVSKWKSVRNLIFQYKLCNKAVFENNLCQAGTLASLSYNPKKTDIELQQNEL